MKIATWNVNSLNVRLPHVLDWLAAQEADVLALQETKLTDDKFPHAEIAAAGYEAAFAGQKTYNGVAILSREQPRDVRTDIANLDDSDRRIMIATVGDVRVINLYVVNGQDVGSEKYEHKLRWLDAVTAHVAGELEASERVVVLGDFNIAPEDRDVHDPEQWRERILCSTPERHALARLLDTGLEDVFRRFQQPEGAFSWWDYRAGAFRRNIGLRIDLILASPGVAERCTASYIDKSPRKLKRPSDHTPVVAEFGL